jgi:amino acid adenylation domain-containing protein
MWFLNQSDPTAGYTIPIILRLTGKLDSTALRAALTDVIDRHESLRTVYPRGADGQPAQEIRGARLEFDTVTIAEADLGGMLARFRTRPFDLAVDLPLRVRLFVLAPDEHVVVLLLHHIAGDGWSMSPLAKDLSHAYAARRAHIAPQWMPLPVQYADFAVWEHEMLGAGIDPTSVRHHDLEYWTNQLGGLPEQITLPTDRPRPATASGRGGTVDFTVPEPLHRALAAVADQCRASLFMVLHAGFAVLLSRMGCGDDIAIGTPTAGRSDDALDDLVGLFVNTLVVRADLTGDPTFRTVVDRSRSTALAAMSHQDLPFDDLVEALNPRRRAGRNPLFQVMLVVQNTAAARFELDGLTVAELAAEVTAAKFDLTLSITAAPMARGVLTGELEYAEDLFTAATARRVVDRLLTLLTRLAADPDQRIGAVDVLPQTERAEVVSGFNDTDRPVPDHSLVDAFATQVFRAPQAVAVAGARTMTYADLDARANQLAHRLIRLGVRAETPVAVLIERSAEVVVATLAIVKAGGCYVPLHPGHSPERLTWMCADAGASILLTDRIGLDLDQATTVIVQDVTDEPTTAPEAEVRPDQLAYVVYTSGSTGLPKGVAVEHRNVVAFAADRRWAGGGHERVLMHSPHAFDASTYELWVPLTRGGTVVVAPPGDMTPRILRSTIAEHAVTGMFLSAGLFRVVAEDLPDCFAPLREVWAGGDVVPAAAVAKVNAACPDTLVVNGYGPTETTTFATSHPVREPGEQVPIGGPIDTMRAYVLDARLAPVPVGVPGELYVGGAQTARGYLHRPGLTAQRFVADPFGPSGGRLYRTGDIARWTDGGVLDFLGRADDQVKIRGFRVEPGEVEAELAAHDFVSAVVVVVRDVAGDRALVAYVVAEAAPEELRAWLAGRLPDYLIPMIIGVDALPLTANGKVDRDRLPTPDRVPATSSRGPRDQREAVLCRHFADLLGVDGVGIDDDFFALGGHSLRTAALLTRIEADLGTRLGIRDVFDAPTVAGLAAKIAAGGPTADPLAVLLPLRTSGERPPLFCIHPAAGIGWGYAGLLRHLDHDTPLYALQARGLTDPSALDDDIAAMAADYERQIRTVRPHGPYRLLGWSFGAGVAHEIAVRLQAAGETVSLLVALDGYPVKSGATSPPDQRALLDSLGITDPTVETVSAAAKAPGSPLAALPQTAVSALIEVFTRNHALAGTLSGGVHRADMVVFTALGDRAATVPDPTTWASFVEGQLTVHETPSTHGALLSPEALAQIGPMLADLLRATDPKTR